MEGHLSVNLFFNPALEVEAVDRTVQRPISDGDIRTEKTGLARYLAPKARTPLIMCGMRLSPWSGSSAKRVFDFVFVLLALPLVLPILLAVALAVRLTSSGPVLFLQGRVGRHGRIFTILKFRTMVVATNKAHHAVTTMDNQQFTSVGPFLRRWKLDELPQLLNVLAGHMSLVGPRPRMPEHVNSTFGCRPGITGAATIAFAREETVLSNVPKHQLNAYYHTVILPAKRRLDAEYMSRATFRSDLKLIIDSALRRWDTSVIDSLVKVEEFNEEYTDSLSRDPERPIPPFASHMMPMQQRSDQPGAGEQVSA